MNEFSITIGIPTFNRAGHLGSLLGQFEELVTQLDISRYNVTLLISDNASDDSTQEVIDKYGVRLENSGYKVSCFKQKINRGMDGNFRFIYDKCESLFLWYFSDDDILIPENIEKLLDDLIKYEPDVCLSNFIQPPYSENNPIFLSGSKNKKELITDPKLSVAGIKKRAKLTNYVIKKIPVDDYKTLIDDCSGDYYLFIVYALLSYSHGEKLLVRSGSIARARDDYLSIQYSPRAFAGLRRSVNKVLRNLGSKKYLELIVKESRTDEMNAALKFLIMHYRGKLKLPPQILAEECSYVRNNFRYIVLSPRIAFRYMMYVISIFWLKFLGVFDLVGNEDCDTDNV